MSEGPAVVAESVTYRVGSVTLVSDVDLVAQPGELLVVLGPNGAGKSTLLELLAASLHPTVGRVTLHGTDTSLASTSELALLRAVLSQRSRGDIPYSVTEIVSMGRFPHRGEATNSAAIDRAMVADAMDRTDTARFARRIYATLSGGEQTRVSLARVVAQDTPIVFFDEPTTALDVAHRERIMREIVSIARQGRTVIAVLHDLNAAAAYADRIVLMNQGRLVSTGSPREVLTEDLLTEVYGQAMVVVDHPFRDGPLVLPGD
jgi:iron complex transport system ATP-binding protein